MKRNTALAGTAAARTSVSGARMVSGQGGCKLQLASRDAKNN